MKKTILFALLATFSLLSCGGDNKANLSGAGASFPEPFYKMVFKKHTALSGTNISYGAIGSGAGISSLKDKTVDFGASDVFVSDKEISSMGAEILHIPTCLGAVVLSFNLKEVKELKLNADVISDIFLGNIKMWDDAKIKELNPSQNLPNKAITLVYRSDGSGTTAVFSEYMSKVNKNWKEKIGEGKSLKFPVGVAAKGNTGVAGMVSQIDGAIGYVGSEYSLALNLPSAMIQNSSGKYVEANIESISASADGDLPDDTRTVITNSSNPNAYPISTFTWILVYKEQNYNNRTEKQSKALKDLLLYVISPEGQVIAKQTNYAPLPDRANQKAKILINKMTYNNSPL